MSLTWQMFLETAQGWPGVLPGPGLHRHHWHLPTWSYSRLGTWLYLWPIIIEAEWSAQPSDHSAGLAQGQGQHPVLEILG